MLFTKLSAVLLGFVSVASTSPLAYNALAAREASAAERGLIWTPRHLQRRTGSDRNGKEIVIVHQTNIQLTQVQIVQEIQIVNVIKNIIVVDGRNEARDNIRRNHYRNRNRNRDVNLIVIVVVVVEDGRDRNNRNRRYITRHVESNPRALSQEWVVVTEQSTLTVDAVPAPSDGVSVAAVPPPVIGTWDAAALPVVGSPDTLLPASIGAPSWPSISSERDPAIIIESDQVAFVSFEGDAFNCDFNFDDGKDRKDDDKKDDDKKDDDKEDDKKDEDKKDDEKYRR